MKGEYITSHSCHRLEVFEAECWSSKVLNGRGQAASRGGQEDSEGLCKVPSVKKKEDTGAVEAIREKKKRKEKTEEKRE